jgi:hypothetical protein
MPVCKGCGILKFEEEFRQMSGGRSRWRCGKCHDCERAYMRAWAKKNRDTVLAKARLANLSNRLACIEAYGSKCECCAEGREEFLAIDHIDGGGYIARLAGENIHKLYRRLIREGFPKGNHRLLCHSCNCSMGFYGYCPHGNLPEQEPGSKAERDARKEKLGFGQR